MQEVTWLIQERCRTGFDLLICDPHVAQRTAAAHGRNKKAASRRLFEFIALSWEVELWGFEPQTSCMPYEPSR